MAGATLFDMNDKRSADKKKALDFAQRAAVEADLARARSQEAVALAEVAQRQAEIADLQRQIGGEGKR